MNNSATYHVRSTDGETKDKHITNTIFQQTSHQFALASPLISESIGIPSLAGPDNAAMIALVSEVSQRRLDLDFNKLRTCGASYRALPSNFPQQKCSGREKNVIAKSVLNDTFISFSSLTSEDSQFVSSKKNTYEENMYHTEDERYEADMIMEVNRAALQNLIVVKRRIDRMTREEVQTYRLDDFLGGTSAILMKKAIHRVYGDKAGDVIYGLKTCPSTVVPIVIQRMRQKDTEWREAVRTFQRFWSDQDSKNYLRSLDHQGATFKQRDNPFIRNKTVINQIESIARGEKIQFPKTNTGDPIGCMIYKCLTSCSTVQESVSAGALGAALSHVIEGDGEDDGMHLTLEYPPPEVCATLLKDVASLVIHHVKRQSNTSKEDKKTMKFLIRTVIQDLFMQERFPVSDDEEEEEDDDDENKLPDTQTNNEYNNTEIRDTITEEQVNATRRTRRTETRSINIKQNTQLSPTLEFPEVQDSDVRPGEKKTPKYTSKRKISTASDFDLIESGNSGVDILKSRHESDFLSTLPIDEYYCVLYGNNHWYAFLRLHHLLITRLSQLRTRALLIHHQHKLENENANIQPADVMRLRKSDQTDPKEHYKKALNLVKDLLDGCDDVTTYEDRLRDMFGIYAYPWFTMDRLVTNLVRQLHILASGDELSHRLTSIFRSRFKNACNRTPGDRDNSSTSDYPNTDSITFGTNGICGPLRSRFSRLTEEFKFRCSAFSACLEFATTSNNQDPNGINNSENVLEKSTSLPNCYAMVTLRQTSKLLIRLLESATVVKYANDQSIPRFNAHTHRFVDQYPTSIEESRTASALQREKDHPNSEVKHWYDYLARYFRLSGFWTSQPVFTSLCARVRPVFLYRNVRRCVNRLTQQAICRRKEEIFLTGDPQSDELILQKLSDQKLFTTVIEPEKTDTESVPASNIKGNLEKHIWELMIGVFRNNLTHTELFRNTYSNDCMQSKKNLSTKSSIKAHKINWSVGSCGIFMRKKEKAHYADNSRSIKKFHNFQKQWLERNVDPNNVCKLFDQSKPSTHQSVASNLQKIESNENLLSIIQESDNEMTLVESPNAADISSKNIIKTESTYPEKSPTEF